MKKKLLIPGIAVFVLLGIGIMSLSAVYAKGIEQGTYAPFVERLSQKFEVNPAEVEDVLQDLQDEKSAEKYAFWSEKLDEAVHYGKITNAQKEAIVDKAFDVEEKILAIGELPEAEQKQELENLYQELVYWAQDRGISVKQFGDLRAILQ